jgi:hypothetical protein
MEMSWVQISHGVTQWGIMSRYPGVHPASGALEGGQPWSHTVFTVNISDEVPLATRTLREEREKVIVRPAPPNIFCSVIDAKHQLGECG